MQLEQAAETMRSTLIEAGRGLVEREFLLELVVLAAVAGEHLLVIGPPGTAKSAAVRRVSSALGGEYFEYLLGRFTEPGEIFGPIDLRRLREGALETDTTGMLPEADIVFLDEVFLGSTAILNTLLGILNERVFRRGRTQTACPLRICVAASNALPTEAALAAFADRFLVRAFVDAVPDTRIEDLLELPTETPEIKGEQRATPVSLKLLDVLGQARRQVDASAITAGLAEGIRLLRARGIWLSDRRIVKIKQLIAAAAVLAGRSNATTADLWALLYAIPTAEEQDEARETLRDLLEPAENSCVPSAAEDASQGMRARAEALLRAGTEALERPADGPGEQLRREGILREIDAAFGEAIPEELRDVREKLTAGMD
ncbi:MAG: AAA family ATPase [bacterium]|nr:AAA family ATPase [bacterium]